MRLKFLFFFIITGLHSAILAQNTVELKVELFTDDKVTVATLDTTYLNPWNQRVQESIKAFLSIEEGNHDVMILVTMPKGKPAFVEVSSRPQIKKEMTDHLIRRIESLSRPPRSTLTEYAYLVEAKVGRGCQDPQLTFLPKIAMPEEKAQAQFEAADLKTKITLFQTWVLEDVIPVLSFYEDSTRSPHSGVNSVGHLLDSISLLEKSANQLTVNNPDYWKASMEMSSGDGLILLSKISMHIVKGEFDLAKRYLDIAQAFPEQNSMAISFYKQLNFRMEWLFDDIKAVINKGKILQQEGDFESAALHFEKALKTLPKSAILNYEKYYSKSLLISDRSPEEIMELWSACKNIVYECDPLYNMNVPAKNSKEVYLMSKRHEINLLFENQVNIQENILSYADIALDLEVFGFAAHLYWLILGNKPDEFKDRDILAHYLYCLDKLGDNVNIKNFEEEFTRQKFTKIEKERLQAMESNETYKRSVEHQNHVDKKGKGSKKGSSN